VIHRFVHAALVGGASVVFLVFVVVEVVRHGPPTFDRRL
jgi:hypothetical protein